jgi:DNA-binding response OmpR family regulator
MIELTVGLAPILFMTALDSVADKVAGFEAGGVDCITKPFQQVEVLARVMPIWPI